MFFLYSLPPSFSLRFSPDSSRFTEIDSLLIPDLLTGSFPLILDCAVGVFLWLPSVYWKREGQNKMALEITDVSLFPCFPILCLWPSFIHYPTYLITALCCLSVLCQVDPSNHSNTIWRASWVFCPLSPWSTHQPEACSTGRGSLPTEG